MINILYKKKPKTKRNYSLENYNKVVLIEKHFDSKKKENITWLQKIRLKKRLHLCFLISVLSASLGGYIWKYVKSVLAWFSINIKHGSCSTKSLETCASVSKISPNHQLTSSWKSLNRQGHSHGCPLSGIVEKLSTHPTDKGK